jgi:hypothetical protein
MYITYAEFKVLFPNVNVSEDEFNIYEAYAEDIVNVYVGNVFIDPTKDISFATGLIIQHMRGLGLLPQGLTSISAGGINTNPNQDFMEYIPQKAKEILDRHREIVI